MVLPIPDAQDRAGKDVRINNCPHSLYIISLNQLPPQRPTTHPPEKTTIHHQSFYVGGTLHLPPSARIMHGQVYVEALHPPSPPNPHPRHRANRHQLAHHARRPPRLGAAPRRPRWGLVRGVVGLEPSGPPFREAEQRGVPKKDRVYGLTTVPVAHEPEAAEGEPLVFEREEGSGCWKIKGGPRRLVNLSRVPVVVVTGEASYHAAYDHLTVGYLREAEVQVALGRSRDMWEWAYHDAGEE